MTSPDEQQLLCLFQKVAPASFLEDICREQDYHFRQGVYSVAVVVWLMIWQRLGIGRSLAAAVQCLLQGPAGVLLQPCKRREQDKISAATGGYCQARQKLPKQVATEVTDRLVEQLRSQMQEGWPGLHRPIFLIDGSSLPLPHTPELVQGFSPGHNQFGANHWPMMRIVVFHDVSSGLALRPSWGPMYGKPAVSEQALAEQALQRLPDDAVVLADCNFGIFAFAWAVQQSRRPMILRLTQERARKILGTTLRPGMDRKLVWAASAWDQKAHPALPTGASLEGRLLVCENPSRPGQFLYLWTSLDLPAESILDMYKLRWNIETDLRSLKRTVGLQQLRGQSVDLVEKELLLAISAYNLVRAVMCLAARRAGFEPRRLSFSFVQTVVEAGLPGLDQATTDREYQQRLERLLRYAAQGKLPKRSRQRSYPREVWRHNQPFPWRKSKGPAQ
jgi:hypothetical protein